MRIAGDRTRPDDEPGGVNGDGSAIRSAKGAQVIHGAAAAGRAAVEEGVGALLVGAAPPDDLARGVDAGAVATVAERAEVVDARRRGERGLGGRRRQSGR